MKHLLINRGITQQKHDNEIESNIDSLKSI